MRAVAQSDPFDTDPVRKQNQAAALKYVQIISVGNLFRVFLQPFFTDVVEDLSHHMSILRMNFQQELATVAMTFQHSCPDCASKYYEFFQSPVVTFDAPASSLALSLDVVDLVLPSGNEELAAVND